MIGMDQERREFKVLEILAINAIALLWFLLGMFIGGMAEIVWHAWKTAGLVK